MLKHCIQKESNEGPKNMKKHISYLVVILLTFSFRYASAQIIAFENPEADLQRARIGLVDEFMKRFNGNEFHPETKPSERDSLNRNYLWLFDYEQFINQDKNIQDSIQAEALNLIEIVKNDSIKINYSDSTWVALAHCKGTVMGKSEKFDIFLTVQSRGEDMYKWVINAVDGECFNIKPRDINDNLIISPDAHETKFITLKRISNEQPHNIQLFLSKNIDYDQTSVFAYLLYCGKLKIDFVERLEFIFLQVPEYAFHIQYFDRLSYNSGWLISNFYRLSDLDKAAFRKMINLQSSIKTPIDMNIQTEDASNASPESTDINLTTNHVDTISINKILIDRINERLFQLQDYLKYICANNNNKSTKKYYAEKLESLFSKDARAVMKNLTTGETNVIDIKKLSNGLIRRKFKDIEVNGITSIIIKTSGSENGAIKSLGTAIIPLSTIAESDVIFNTICEQLLPYHPEETEDGVEYLFDFGDIYISVK